MPEIPVQEPMPGFEDYVCTFKCLTHCPAAAEGQNCWYDDPDLLVSAWCGEVEHYTEFYNWRYNHLTEEQEEQLAELTRLEEEGGLLITFDPIEFFFPQPGGNVTRCPRCFSTDVTLKAERIICGGCDYSEALHDYPVARRYYDIS